MPNASQIYPRKNEAATVYLKNVITNPAIEIGDYTIYHDETGDPTRFESENVLYHYPINNDRLVIGRFCSIAKGVRFLFNSANHSLNALSTYPFPLFWDEWHTHPTDVIKAWDNKGDIIVGNDVWIGYDAVILAGVTIGDGAIVGARAVVTHDVEPYTIVGGIPAKTIRQRFDASTIELLLTLQWWNWPEKIILQSLSAIQSGNIAELEAIYQKNILRAP